MSLVWYSLVASLVWSLLAPDMCTRLNEASFCMDSGFCSNTEPPLACRDAYIRASEGLLKLNPLPPIITHLAGDLDFYQDDVSYLRGEWMPPLPNDSQTLAFIRSDPYHLSFLSSLLEYNNLLEKDFPFIRYESCSVFVRLVRSVGSLQFQYRSLKMASPSYNSILLNLHTIASITTQIRIYIEYVSALARTDPLRKAMFANLLPFIHAWMLVQVYVNIQKPILLPELIDFITSAAQYDPLYMSTEHLKTWFVYLPRMDGNRDTTPPVIPFVEPVPLTVYDYFDIPIDEMNTSNVVERITSGINSTNSQYQWLAALFMQNHPEVAGAQKEQFCTNFLTRTNQVLPFKSDASREMQMKMIAGISDLYRLCGDAVVSLDFRINHVLPTLLRRINITNDYEFDRADEYKSTTEISIYSLRQDTRVFIKGLSGTPTEKHIEYLSNLLEIHIRSPIYTWLASDEAFGPAPRRVMETLGSAAALLLVQGDPTGVLRLHYPTLKLNSVSFRSGFCKVLNCVAFETLFHEGEIPLVLETLRTTL